MIHKTNIGALISIVMVSVCAILCGGEILNFVHPPMKEELISVSEMPQQLSDLTISYNITVEIPCALTHLDFYTKIGKLKDSLISQFKLRLDANGNPIAPLPNTTCGSCYGAVTSEKKCCNTCEDIINAYQLSEKSIENMSTWEQCKREGIKLDGSEKCQIFGTAQLYAVDGGFHIGPGINNKYSLYKHDYSPISEHLNLSHQINMLQFGNRLKKATLDDTQVIQEKSGNVHYRYHLKVVPTVYVNENEEETNGFQYTVNFAEMRVNEDEEKSGPGIFFVYSFAPIAVVRKPDRVSPIILCARLMSIGGGAFMLAKLIDSLTFRLDTVEAKKLIGKFF